MKNVYNLWSLSPDYKCVNLFFIDGKIVNTF